MMMMMMMMENDDEVSNRPNRMGSPARSPRQPVMLPPEVGPMPPEISGVILRKDGTSLLSLYSKVRPKKHFATSTGQMAPGGQRGSAACGIGEAA